MTADIVIVILFIASYTGTVIFVCKLFNTIKKENLDLKRKLIDGEISEINKNIDSKPLSDLVRDANESDGDHT